MKNILLLCLLFPQMFLLGKLQEPSLIGKWNFSKYESSQQLDEESKAMLNNAFSKFAFEFKDDATYSLQKKRKLETGTWKADGEFVTTTTTDGFSEKIKIIQKHNDTIRLEIERGEFVVFYRAK